MTGVQTCALPIWTNAMFVSTEEAAPIQLIQETILTPSTSNIWKIEFVNGVCFAFLHDEKVLYGKDMGNWCQKKGKPYPAPAEQERAVNPCKDVLAAQGRDGE